LPVWNLLYEKLDATNNDRLTEECETEGEGGNSSPPFDGNDGENNSDWNENGTSEFLTSLILGVRLGRAQSTIVEENQSEVSE